MAGQENLPGQQLEGQGEEPYLPQHEVGQLAYQLIGAYKQAIRRTPEFAQALQDWYFADIPHDTYSMIRTPDSPERAIIFVKGDYRYGVKYTAGTEMEELRIDKSPVEYDGHKRRSESICLVVYVNRQSRLIDAGTIQHAVYVFGSDEEPDCLTNTQTAVQRVQNFLITNFGSN